MPPYNGGGVPPEKWTIFFPPSSSKTAPPLTNPSLPFLANLDYQNRKSDEGVFFFAVPPRETTRRPIYARREKGSSKKIKQRETYYTSSRERWAVPITVSVRKFSRTQNAHARTYTLLECRRRDTRTSITYNRFANTYTNPPSDARFCFFFFSNAPALFKWFLS